MAAAVAVIFAASAVQAADMALKEPSTPPAWTWTGLYLGGELGGRWQSSRWNTTRIEAGFTGAAGPNATANPADAARST